MWRFPCVILIYKLSKLKFYTFAIFSFSIVALYSRKQVRVVVVLVEPLSKEAWVVLKMERVLNILVFLQMFFHVNDQTTSTHDRNVIEQKEERDSSRRFWSNATFSFLLDKFEERYWESNKKPMKKQNWEAFYSYEHSLPK
jgi:hypothetical protein